MSIGKQVAVILGSVFAVALAVVVSKEMSTEVMAVVVGVVCGVAAGIPTSVLLLVVLTRRERQAMEEAQRQAEYPERGYPPVVVIRRDQAPPLVPEMGYWPATSPAEIDGRLFVVHEDDLLPGGR